MSTEATAAYVEEFLPEDEPLLMARRNAAQVGGASPVSPAVGAATTPPLGAYVINFRLIAERSTISRQRPR